MLVKVVPVAGCLGSTTEAESKIADDGDGPGSPGPYCSQTLLVNWLGEPSVSRDDNVGTQMDILG
jgi:hypothetical protein